MHPAALFYFFYSHDAATGVINTKGKEYCESPELIAYRYPLTTDYSPLTLLFATSLITDYSPLTLLFATPYFRHYIHCRCR